MKGSEFFRKLKKLAKQDGIDCYIQSNQGKGGHQTIYYGTRRATIPDLKKELKTGLQKGICKQLGIRNEDLK